MHFTTKQTVSIDREGGVTLPENIFNEVQLTAIVTSLLLYASFVHKNSLTNIKNFKHQWLGISTHIDVCI